jgi:hypothetical protein
MSENRNESCRMFTVETFQILTMEKHDRHYITEILLKVALNTTKQTNKQTK